MGDGMSDCRAAGTRAANSPWLIVFLLLAFGFTPVLRAQVHIAQSQPRTVHVFVALADNKNQGIVPVAAILGNGEDPQHNLRSEEHTSELQSPCNLECRLLLE